MPRSIDDLATGADELGTSGEAARKRDDKRIDA
jgi:hypothetical protein